MAPLPESDELRALQQKAYGRGGGLTEAEAARLRALEALGSGHDVPEEPSAPPVVERGSAATERGAERAERVDATTRVTVPPPQVTELSSPRFVSPEARSTTEGVPAASTTEGVPAASTTEGVPAASPVAASSWRQDLRRHGKAVAAASALLLLVGIGTGWALFAPRVRDAVALTAEEAQHKLELDEDYDFDEGTLRAVVRDDDALVWFGTQSDGEQSCLVLDAAEQTQVGCSPTDGINTVYGMNATITLPPDEDATEGDFGTSINAYGMLSSTGEPMVAIQRWDQDASVLDQFEGDERTRAQELIDEGFEAGLSLAGYVRGEPAWIAYRFTDSSENERCLIVDALDGIVCGSESDTLTDGLTITGDGDGGRIDVSAGFTNWGQPYLTVTENPGGASTTVIDTETGDPIEVTDPEG